MSLTQLKLPNSLSHLPFMAMGAFLAAFGLKSFILPSGFVDGGATGISILLSFIFPIPLSAFLFLVNLPFVYLAWKFVGKRMAVNTTQAVLLLSLIVAFVEFPVVTSDKLLCAIFGGVFLGSGIGMAIRGNTALDGTEILAVVLSRRTAFTVGNIITLLNVVVFGSAIFVVGVEASMYSILTYFAASRSVDFFLYGLEEFYGVTIVSSQHDIIRKAILEQMQRGVTLYEGHGGYSQKQTKIIFCIITKLETARLKRILALSDPKAFVVYHPVRDAQGGLTQKRYMGIKP